jgi:hypothetical protein
MATETKVKIGIFLISIFVFTGCGVFRKARLPETLEVPLPKVSTTEVRPEEVALLKERAFPVGEKLTYSLRWTGVHVGHATLEVKDIIEFNDSRAYRVISRARSNDFFSLMYRVDDMVQSFIDINKFHSLRLEKRQEEGNYRSFKIIEYDQVNHTARQFKYKDGSVEEVKFSIPPNVHDILSCLYYLRNQSVNVGESVFIKVSADDKNYDLEVKVHKKERIEIPNLGAYDAILVEPIAKFKGIFMSKGKMLVWVTDDSRKIPLLMKSRIPVGSLVAVLEKIEGYDK